MSGTAIRRPNRHATRRERGVVLMRQAFAGRRAYRVAAAAIAGCALALGAAGCQQALTVAYTNQCGMPIERSASGKDVPPQAWTPLGKAQTATMLHPQNTTQLYIWVRPAKGGQAGGQPKKFS